MSRFLCFKIPSDYVPETELWGTDIDLLNRHLLVGPTPIGWVHAVFPCCRKSLEQYNESPRIVGQIWRPRRSALTGILHIRVFKAAYSLVTESMEGSMSPPPYIENSVSSCHSFFQFPIRTERHPVVQKDRDTYLPPVVDVLILLCRLFVHIFLPQIRKRFSVNEQNNWIIQSCFYDSQFFFWESWKQLWIIHLFRSVTYFGS